MGLETKCWTFCVSITSNSSVFTMFVRVGNAAGMVVRHRVHLVLRRGYCEYLWERARHHHLESQLWNWLLVWLDYDRTLWSTRGTWCHELSLQLKDCGSILNPCTQSFPDKTPSAFHHLNLNAFVRYTSANDNFGLLFLFLSKSSKVLAKRELLYVPLIGWTWYFLEIVFCKRKWEEDRDTVIEGLKRLADYPEYMWVSVGFLC